MQWNEQILYISANQPMKLMHPVCVCVYCVSVCVCVCVGVCVCGCVAWCMSVNNASLCTEQVTFCLCVFLCVCVSMCVCLSVSVCVFLCLSVCLGVSMCVCVCVCVCVSYFILFLWGKKRNGGKKPQVYYPFQRFFFLQASLHPQLL